MKQYIMALDQGTTSSRTIIYDKFLLLLLLSRFSRV